MAAKKDENEHAAIPANASAEDAQAKADKDRAERERLAKQHADFKGSYIHQPSGEEYALKIDLNDPHGRTHKLMTVPSDEAKKEAADKKKQAAEEPSLVPPTRYWEGTEEEFKKDFEKK